MLLTSVARIIFCNIFLVLTYLNMLQFFKDSVRELKHVVWPTREETKKYFVIVVTILVLFGTYLFIASTAFSEAILYLKNIVS